jgi:hypothetical protein
MYTSQVPLAAHVAMQQFGMFFFPFFLGGATRQALLPSLPQSFFLPS